MELKDVPGIGDKTVAELAKAGITNLSDLLTTFPRTYRTYRATTSRHARIGEWVVLKGTITRPQSKHTARVTTQLATFRDSDGALTLRWFNMPYLTRSVSPSSTYLVRGQLTEFAGRRQIVAPQLSKNMSDADPDDEVVPIYSARGGLKPWVIRQKIYQALSYIDPLPDPLPLEIVNKYNLLDYHSAITQIHLPPSGPGPEGAIRRLSFQELYKLQLDSIRLRNTRLKKGHALKIITPKVQSFLASLPFEMTNSQTAAIHEILADLNKPIAMRRLLQGEVGSGKTIVAAAAAIATVSAGFRTLLMAPTLILANQLFDNFVKYCSPLDISVSLVTARSKGDITSDILIGTQALLTSADLSRVGLVIVDEQHRFGVEQREKLAQVSISPHILQMTATPIPRSLAQTVFHHLDITRLTDVPKNRLPTKTYLVPETKRDSSYTWIRSEITSHQNQVFIVVPLIEAAAENEVSPLKSLRQLEISLQKWFPEHTIDVMHGKMKESEKLEHMTKFQQGLTQILVATSMIEVGIDIPEANIIVIEDAERFGLAQLHQLRGRVGRGGKQGYCLLFSQSTSDRASERLAYFIRENNGEKLAEFDLQSRGPGELFGLTQSGFFNLKLGSMYDDRLLAETYEAAKITLYDSTTQKTLVDR